MVPIYVKGGSWSNIEDQTLKAAVSKYGLNQWHRVASLLARKTAKQAKARWNEFLDPRIRKTDWTQQEDMKLLELARLLPNQWRSIASTIGRTATQCIERYQRLLDDDEGSNDLKLSGPGIETLESIGASKDLQIGDINVNAETKEARPDSVDLDDDEREMLSEARARLANTRGKKATRKARERMLEESRRIALLQKRRDLKQTGITTRLKAPKKKYATQMDYNKDVAFQHAPVKGFYDTTEETVQNEREFLKFEKTVDKYGVKEKEEKQKKKRHRDDNKDKASKDVYESEKKEFVEDLSKRRKLLLPEPIFKDDELSKLSEDGVNTLVKERINDEQFAVDDKIKDITRKIKESKVERSALLTTGEIEDLEKDENEESYVKREEETSKVALGLKSSLKEKLLNLPKPKNDFEILDDDEEDDDNKTNLIKGNNDNKKIIDEDLGESERLRLISEETERKKALLRRSQAVQKSLEIPRIDSSLTLDPLDDKSVVLANVDNGLLKLIRSDYYKLNKKGGSVPLVGDLDELSKEIVEAEIAKEINVEELNKFQNDFATIHRAYQDESKLDKESLITVLSEMVEQTNKLEKKVEIKFAGYVKRNEKLFEESMDLVKQLKEADRALTAFEMLQQSEKIAIQSRLDLLREQTDELVQAKHKAEERYLVLKRGTQ